MSVNSKFSSWVRLGDYIEPCDETNSDLSIKLSQGISNNKEFQIIDGQQRLTTMSLLILSTLKCLKELVDSGIEAENNLKRKDSLLNSYIGYVDPVTLISNNKLKLNRNSDDYYQIVN